MEHTRKEILFVMSPSRPAGDQEAGCISPKPLTRDLKDFLWFVDWSGVFGSKKAR